MSNAEEKKEDTQNDQNADGQSTPQKGGLMKYIIMGVAVIALIGVSVFVAMMFMGGKSADHPTEPSTTESTETHADSTHNEQLADNADNHDEIDSLFLDENDPSVIDMIEENLAVMDWDPNAGMTEEELTMSAEDSVEAVNWLDSEKKKLAKRENDLEKREEELAKLDISVTQKILRIEQEESSRIGELAKLYDGMDSRAVAQLMANLDDDTIVSILPKMKSKNASAVLQLLPAQRAARLSKQMITIAEK
ncbi:MAG: hypothetical protein ABIJ12_01425 [bacterium]